MLNRILGLLRNKHYARDRGQTLDEKTSLLGVREHRSPCLTTSLGKRRSFAIGLLIYISLLFSILYSQSSVALDHGPQLEWDNHDFLYPKQSNFQGLCKPITPDPYQLTSHYPNYFLPIYYRPSDHEQTYFRPVDRAHLPMEIAFQISLKIPIWKSQKTSTTLFAAYTQHSYWHAYVSSPFFRASDYQPEFILEQPLNIVIQPYLKLVHIKFGIVHQSNGMGEEEERSWDRIYADLGIQMGNWTLSLKPWTILNTKEFLKRNPDMQDYLGSGAISLKYTYQQNQIILTYLKKALKFQAMFPISPSLRGMLYIFHGYGESLIEYNNLIKSIGLGIALNA